MSVNEWVCELKSERHYLNFEVLNMTETSIDRCLAENILINEHS